MKTPRTRPGLNRLRRQALLLAALAPAAGLARAQGGHQGATAATAAPPPVPAQTADPVRRGRPLQFPRDHGAHLGQRTEWWYATGWLAPRPAGSPGAADAALAPPAGSPLLGFQITFFRSRTGLAGASLSRFAPRQLLFAHAAITDLAGGRHLHDQRLLRWSEAPDAATGAAATDDARVHIGPWRLQRGGPWPGGAWQAQLPAAGFGIELRLRPSQPLLLQGDAGFSRKGPDESQASHYYSLPQLQASGQLVLDGQPRALQGRAWLDHEWSDEILHPQAVGWDWIGINLFDGSALTAFRLRRADGSSLWAGGSFRSGQPGAVAASFEPEAVQWQPGRLWRSPSSAARYPVEWVVQTPAGRYGLRALADAQELDSRGSTGAIYWEGLAELLDEAGTRVGLGYLEMTGYAGPLRMG